MKIFQDSMRVVFAVLLDLMVLLQGISFTAEPAPSVLEVGSSAEWYRPTDILMHTPGDELFLGVIHPAAALFERAFDIQVAAKEHEKYIERLRAEGAKVYTVTQVLLSGTVDEDGKAVEGPELDQLREFTRKFITYDVAQVPEQREKQREYLSTTLKTLHPRELVKIILNQPTVSLESTDALNTGLTAKYGMSPVMNLYFLRDQMITTPKGIVIGKMNSPQRAVETEIIRFVLSKMNAKVVYEVKGDGRLEGGDFIPADDIVFQGQGLRTNADAVQQLLSNDAYGAKRVVVVKEPWKNQIQMHLDTYFNIIGPVNGKKLAVLVEGRIRTHQSDFQPVDIKKHLTVDVYEHQTGGGYIQVAQDKDFQDYVEGTLGFTLIGVSDQDQANYGINFLTVAPGRILGVDGVSDVYKETLKQAGVKAEWMDFSNLKGGYGAAHCSVQVLHRVAPGR
jgi:arginine deiminase